jgi:DNA invertase Pin-like site-specific DNA recombinase
MKTAYSYARFSTPEQSLGDSERRQIDGAREYAANNGFTLDETTVGVDRGKSGYHGENVEEGGALFAFLKLAKEGKISKGSALIVENPDRISRRKFFETYSEVYLPILNAGVELHFLSIRDVLRPGHSFVEALRVGVEIDRAHSESAMKSERLGKVWSKKKHNSEPGLAITSRLPGWLQGRVGEPITVNEVRAKVVVRIFEMTASGVGRRLIAKRLNEDKVPTFSGAGGPKLKGEPRWIDSYIDKILRNRAVLGEYQPRKRSGEADGQARLDFYPPIVTPDLWQRAQESTKARRISMSFAGRAGSIRNLFSGLLFDAENSRPLHYINKGRNEKPKLIVDYEGPRRAIVYADFEKSFLRFLDQLDWTEVLDVAESTELLQAEEEVGRLRLDIERSGQTIEKLANLLLDTPSTALKQKLLATEDKLEADKISLATTQERLASLRQRNQNLLDESVVYSQLLAAKDIPTRTRLREEIRRKVKRIEFDFAAARFPEPIGLVNHSCRVLFVNGASRYLFFAKSGVYVFEKPAEFSEGWEPKFEKI